MSEALYRKWRPRLWEGVVGQDHIVQTLKNAIRSNRIGHAYLFSGPRGTGKTTTARLLAKAVNCLDEKPGNRPCNHCEHCLAVNNNRFMDLIEIDAASNTSVDDVRSLREKIGFSPSQGRYKVYIIDEVHMLSTAAFNALLKTLEEPPSHAIFILATTEVHKIPATVLSRCQRHEFRRIPVNTIVRLLRDLAEKESIDVDDESLMLIARQSTGAMRDAISLLDQLASTGEKITLDRAHEVLGTATNQSVINLVNAILENNAGKGLDSIHSALDSGSDPRQFARQIVEYFRGLLLIKLDNGSLIEATQDVRAIMSKQSGQFESQVLIEVVRLFNNAANESRLAWQPGLPLELALAQVLAELEKPTTGDKIPENDDEAKTETKNKLQSKRDSELERAKTIESDLEPKKKQNKQPDSDKFEEIGAVTETSDIDNELSAIKSESDQPISLKEIHTALAQVKILIKKNHKKTEALLSSAKNFSVKNGSIVIAFQSLVLKERIEKGEHQEIIQRAFSHVLGKDVHVKAVVSSSKDTIIDQDYDIENNPIVSAAIELGGKIVDKE